MNQPDHLIELKQVQFSYSNDRPLFRDLSVKFKTGAFYLIQGPSGTGKSSLLKLLNRMHDPRGGELLFRGEPVKSYQPQLLRRQILYVHQTPVLINDSVKNNILLPFTFEANHALPKPDDEQIKNRLAEFQLEQIRLSDNALNLSVGQQQRLCFIRGLLLSPEVILLDEPTSALDETSSRIVDSSAARLCRESGQTVIMVNHKKFDQAGIRTIIMKLEDGKIQEV